MSDLQSGYASKNKLTLFRNNLAVDVVDLVDESVAVFGLNLRVTAWNTEAERLYGWKRDEVIGGSIKEVLRCSAIEPLSEILAKVHETGEWRGEFTRTTKACRIVVVDTKWTLRCDVAGLAQDIVETSRDITEIKRTEESLEQVQYQYQNLFRASVASFLELEFTEVANMVQEVLNSGVVDLREYFRSNPLYVRQLLRAVRIADVNELGLHMFGNGDRELLGSLDPLWPDESLGVFAESVVSAFEKKRHYSSEAVLFSISGKRLDTLFTVSYPPQMLVSARLLVGIVDITDAKNAKADQEKSERRYRDLFQSLPVSLLQLEGRKIVDIFEQARSQGIVDFAQYAEEHPKVLDAILDDLKIVEVNLPTVSMLRAQSMEEFVGCSIARYWTESRSIFREVIGARYAGKSGFQAQVKMRAHDGVVIDALFFAAYGTAAGATRTSVVGLIDISDRVRAQEMLANVQAEIAHAARVSVLGELTASIAHEVSQPLTAIESNTEATRLWLEQTPPNLEEVLELSARTAAEVQRAADIINRIRSMAIRATPEQQSVELHSIIEEAMLFLRHELQRNRISTSFQLFPGAPTIFGDRVQLQQVIVNLAVNAIQAMAHAESDERMLMIRTFVTADRSVLLEIRDTGPGIIGDALGRLFESFFTTKATGMGIGLTICRSIIEAHGGQISVDNCVDRSGAKFTICLPCQANDHLPS